MLLLLFLSGIACRVSHFKGGWSPLMRVVGVGNKGMVEALLKVQCDVEIQEDVRIKTINARQ